VLRFRDGELLKGIGSSRNQSKCRTQRTKFRAGHKREVHLQRSRQKEHSVNPGSSSPRQGDELRGIGHTGGGPAAYNVNVSPAEGAAGTMRLLGLRVSLPPSPMRRDAEGKESRGPWQFADIDPRDQAAQPCGVPGGPGVGYLEYQNQADRLKPERFQRAMELAKSQVPDPRRTAGEIHANTARQLLSVWVVVPNADEAVKQAARFGFAATKNHRKALGEEGQEVQCGEGTVVFFEAAHPDSALANLVKKRGLGPFGISVGVADLKMAQRIVQDGTHTSFETQQTENRMSFIIPSEVAAGTVFEFVQQ
jgi:hypothetical protein